ncbi:hypothetical protein [Olleya sp. 1-3]|uniref:hypothetical protein n=1 Tax=Olleya sp. 1-3 TaxID=2058323 RepID=UPI0012FEE8DC|nr:hypothetical protein [Olleya sp. 1-3]
MRITIDLKVLYLLYFFSLLRSLTKSSSVASGKLYSVFSVELVTKLKDFSLRFAIILLLLFNDWFAAIIAPSPPMISKF